MVTAYKKNAAIIKCIYCGTTECLSESDIIPDALTNAKILNRNVCKIAHNNRFSDLFESEVIEKLALITNELDIKSSKSKHYAQYNATITVGDESYNAKNMVSDVNIFNGRKMKSIDGKTLIGPLNDLKKIASKAEDIDEVDINVLEIEKDVKIDVGVYFSEAMYRLIAKIAYEWYCLKNEINDKYSEFDKIIKFIVEGIGEDIVTLVDNTNIISMFRSECQVGSHCLLSYINKNNEILVVVDLFGIMLYQVKVGVVITGHCKYDYSVQEFMVDGTKEGIDYSNIFELYSFLANNFIEKQLNSETLIQDILIKKTLFLCSVNCFLIDNEIYSTITRDEIVSLIIENIQNILQTSILHKKSLKRFVKEHVVLDKPICLNPNGTNKKEIFLFYILYLIGKQENIELNDRVLKNIIEENLGEQFGNQNIIDDIMCNKLKKFMIKDQEYSNVILSGAKVVLAWND